MSIDNQFKVNIYIYIKPKIDLIRVKESHFLKLVKFSIESL